MILPPSRICLRQYARRSNAGETVRLHGRWLPCFAFRALLAAALCASIPADARAQDLSLSDSAQRVAIARASAEVGESWLEIAFPPVALRYVGCAHAKAHGSSDPSRRYQWHVTARFPGSSYPYNHFMAIYVSFTLPDSVPMGRARLDSALRTLRITVDEARGEPPMITTRTEPVVARARYENQQLRLRVEGTAAVGAFLRARGDSVSLGWCQRDVFLPFTAVALRRHAP